MTGKPLPAELRARVVAFVAEGHPHRSAALRFRVSIKLVNDLVIMKPTTGALRPVIPPFLTGCIRRTYAAIFSFWAGVMPPMPMFGRSLL
jgi:hypothetical protein